MGYVAGEAGNIHVLVMSADTALVGVADQTFFVSRFELAMGFMAALALEGTHGALCRNLVMADKTFLFLRHGGLFAVHMAAQAGEALHAHAVNSFVRMTLEAFFFVGGEIMLVPGMAFLAGNLFHKDMPGMAIGFSHGYPALTCSIQVAGFATVPRLFKAMLLLDAAFVSSHNICQKQFVLAEYVH